MKKSGISEKKNPSHYATQITQNSETNIEKMDIHTPVTAVEFALIMLNSTKVVMLLGNSKQLNSVSR